MYEVFDHTADVGIRVRAASLDGLFADAARGLFAVMVENFEAVEPVEEATFELEADDVEELLHDWLAELLYTFAARRLAFAEFDVRIEESERRGQVAHPERLAAIARGEPLDLRRHRLDVEVKAVTWHGLKVERQPDGWIAEVIIDI